jgi:hypothetical protein
MHTRTFSTPTLVLAIAVTALITAFITFNHEAASAETYLSTSRFQVFPGTAFGHKEAESVLIFDAGSGILRMWDSDTVTTYEFNDFQKIPEKRVYRSR